MREWRKGECGGLRSDGKVREMRMAKRESEDGGRKTNYEEE